jgi:hypothetical protein
VAARPPAEQRGVVTRQEAKELDEAVVRRPELVSEPGVGGAPRSSSGLSVVGHRLVRGHCEQIVDSVVAEPT